jgi:hypothetical protein
MTHRRDGTDWKTARKGIVIAVTDTGIGMSRYTQSRIAVQNRSPSSLRHSSPPRATEEMGCGFGSAARSLTATGAFSPSGPFRRQTYRALCLCSSCRGLMLSLHCVLKARRLGPVSFSRKLAGSVKNPVALPVSTEPRARFRLRHGRVGFHGRRNGGWATAHG